MKIRLPGPSLYKNVFIVGSKCLDFFFYTILILASAIIVGWVIYNDGHIKIDDYAHSTVVLKTQEAIRTNYSENDFNKTYVNSTEFQNYNRVWDRTDFVFFYPDEIHFMTNMVITANQTRGICPDNPVIRNFECNPKNNTCRKGFKSSNGIHTGNCVQADFPLDHFHHWKKNGYACEMEGWCPVDRVLVPLNNYRPILLETISSTLYIDNSVEFPNYNIVINNLLHGYCLYHPIENPDCPIFKLGDIIKYTEKAGESYEEMAKFGATIDINIEWKCFKPMLSSNINPCKPRYSFRRVDVWGNRSQIIYYSSAYYNSNGDKRNNIKGYRIRFAVNVKASLRKFDLFRFSVVCLACTPMGWTLICLIYRKFAKYLYTFIDTEEKIDVSKSNHRYSQNVQYNSIDSEDLPLVH